MKKLLVVFLMITTIAQAQKLEENKIDEFTKHSLKRTSWETLNASMKYTAYVRVSSIDEVRYLNLKLSIGGKVFGIRQGDEIMFKLDNDSIVSLRSLKSEITCKGCGAKGFMGSAAPGIEASYVIDSLNRESLLSRKIAKVRIYTSDGYIENDVKDKASEYVKNAVKIVQ